MVFAVLEGGEEVQQKDTHTHTHVPLKFQGVQGVKLVNSGHNTQRESSSFLLLSEFLVYVNARHVVKPLTHTRVGVLDETCSFTCLC
jgi:hypothetical protein